jgi:hypothetical protein
MSYVTNAQLSEKSKPFGNGQCVALVRALTGAPPSSLWSEGASLVSALRTGRISKGTAIATFVNGRYPNWKHGNHAAIFVREVTNGIEIYDQWHRHSPELRTIRFNEPAAGTAQRPELYSVVE